MGLSLYLAASWSRKDEIDALIPYLDDAGHNVVSMWTKESGTSSQWLNDFSNTRHRLNAQRDLLEIQIADVLVLFSQGYGTATRGGARFFEQGFANACGIPSLIVGDREIIFHSLPDTYQVGELTYVIDSAGNAAPQLDELLWTLSQIELLGTYTPEVAA